MDLLTQILQDIDTNYTKIPSFKDFKITESDKANFFILLKATIDYEKFELLYSGYPKRDTTFYQAFIANCDTISDATIAAFFEQPISSWSTSHHYFEAVVTNKKGNELKIMREYTMAEYPYLFPLKIYYAEDKYFNCYNIELAHYLDSAIPDYFSNKSMFNNAYFLLKLSDYLYYKK